MGVSPAVVLSVILAAMYGCAFHLWVGHTLQELVLYLVASGLGFALGQILGEQIGLHWLMVGQVRLLESAGGSFALLVLARWLRVRSR
jgi:hypothetical protein